MKKYILKFLALCLAVLLPFAAYFVYVQAKPAVYTYSIMGTVHYKLRLLDETPSPRVILAGGSSSPYATDCAYIAEELGVPTINVGATVYLGLDFYLSMLEKNMREGDTIVLAPEHVMLAGNELSYEIVWSAIENQPAAWQVVPLGYWPGLVREYHAYAGGKLAQLEAETVISYMAPVPGYHRDFGPLGDVTLEREAILESGYNTEDLIALNTETLSPEVAKKLNRFYAKAQKQGVQVLFAFAPVNALAVTTPESDWQALDATLRAALDMPVLGSLAESVLPGDLFYDSNNHLTSEGAALYSQRLAAYLAQYME